VKGDFVGLSTNVRSAVLAASAALVAAIQPAAAQITFGSPADPARVAVGAGAFDITPGRGNNSKTAGEWRGEYRFRDTLGPVAPFIGGSATSDGAFYGYFGFGMDINFGPNWVLTPNAAFGGFERGTGTNLGSVAEFRTGVELAYRFADLSRLGVAAHHTSNAGIGKRNPGEQSILVMYSVPFRWAP